MNWVRSMSLTTENQSPGTHCFTEGKIYLLNCGRFSFFNTVTVGRIIHIESALNLGYIHIELTETIFLLGQSI